MKPLKTIVALLVIFLLFLSSFRALAQNERYQNCDISSEMKIETGSKQIITR